MCYNLEVKMDVANIANSTNNVKMGCGAVIFGFVAFILSFFILFLNEANYVKNIRKANFIKSNVVSVNSYDAINNNKLVHFSGNITTNAVLGDNYVRVNTPVLDRTVKMYQWEERSHKSSSGHSTSYRYEKVWSEHEINSAHFRRSGHDNPPMPLKSKDFIANSAKIGDFTIDRTVLNVINPVQDLYLNNLKGRYSIEDGTVIFIPNRRTNNGIGDLKISYKYVPVNTQVSVIAQQMNDTLTAFSTLKGKAKYVIALAETGSVSAETMIKHFEDSNAKHAWMMRGIGLLAMFIGLLCLASPITTLLSFIPIFGYLGNKTIALLAIIVSICLSAITIAVAWIAVRPEIAIPVVIAAAGAIFFYLTSGGGGSKNIPPAPINPQQPMPPV